ncbi:CYTH and CHAD domain-containing protein [Streptomyces hirsutus]|uniref:CYTH and CHAD domain-containing protein n=1 Tax=Streptomyces hirsutus TaxID=35620 RepID=A0ABZ1GMV5_9ACTN|nr:CYTH and CHAD domain-containing protein [Streptomyces hirsutus]WSD06621.1 CYTH and CHAD domain-containing protein [Streptomyces hirsutus]WTD19981.1 CYTH and CHAD domain-containing protein [Streptomyces hirsutus]WTD75116.1 CYTH and CHAD domain-containing protein [Streptomyces sp. NBC_01635]
MADTKREVERKYESGDGGLPDLTGVPGLESIVDRGVAHLDALYYDTADERLAASSLTLRKRTGGSDAGWHLKFPVAPGVRDEVHAPLSDTLPESLARLVRSRVRHAELSPVVRLRSDRDLRHLLDGAGRLLAEISVDTVHAERLTGEGGTARWTEIEVELADDGDPAFLDKVDKKLRKAGLRPSDSPSKLARALAETESAATTPQAAPAPAVAPAAAPKRKRRSRPVGKPVTAGDHVLAYIRAQRDALVELDPAVRQGVPDSVHRMRVATRRLRSTFRSFRSVLDRKSTDPIGVDLKWLAAELGLERDQEVLAGRLLSALDELPDTLVHGPVHHRLTTWAEAGHSRAHSEVTAVLDSRRYLTLLDTLDTLLADPPLRKKAAGDPDKVLAKAVSKDLAKVSALVSRARDLPPGHDRDVALHEARKKTKRTRYAAEAAGPALKAPAKDLVKSMKELQSLLGDHQDSVMARRTLRELSAVAHAAGESAFTYGLLHGHEERRAEIVEAALPETWTSVRKSTDF